MSVKVKLAVIGAGTWGENHVRIYQQHPFAEVVAICDRDKTRADALADKAGIPAAYADAENMLANIEYDAVAITTPDFAHADLAVLAARHKKHILIEKPLATTPKDMRKIVAAVQENGVRAMVDLHNRWSPPFNEAYRSVQQGELGQLQSAYFRLNDIKWVATDMLSWAARSSILWFLGSHSLDTLRWLMGSEVRRVYCVSNKGVLSGQGVDTVDVYQSTLEFENGAIAQMENGWITPNANPCVNDIKFNLVGDKGMISIDASNHNLIQKYTDSEMIVPDVLVNHSIFGKPKGFAFESIRAFVDCLVSGEEFPVTLEDAIRNCQIIFALFESAESRMPVEVVYN